MKKRLFIVSSSLLCSLFLVFSTLGEATASERMAKNFLKKAPDENVVSLPEQPKQSSPQTREELQQDNLIPKRIVPPPASAPEASVPATRPLKLTEDLHKQYLSDEDYAFADALLNVTWKLIKSNLSKEQYSNIQQLQRKWIAEERDALATKYSQNLPATKAFAKAMGMRAVALSRLIAKRPQDGNYEGKDASFILNSSNSTIQIQGESWNSSGNTCYFEGKGIYDDAWFAMRHDGMPDFYILSTPKGISIFYYGDGSEQGCGMNTGFSGFYRLK